MDFRTDKKTGKKYPITDFRSKLDKFQIGGDRHSKHYPREQIVKKSGFYDNDNITAEEIEAKFWEAYNADQKENNLHSLSKSNIMDYYTEDNTATGIANRKDMRELAFMAFNNSLRSKGKPEVTKEKFEADLKSSKTNEEKKEGLQFISAKGIRPPKPTMLDRIRIIEAEKGFKGIVKKETTFKVAEHDKPEFVSVVPLKKKTCE
jgi:hypothetical protein